MPPGVKRERTEGGQQAGSGDVETSTNKRHRLQEHAVDEGESSTDVFVDTLENALVISDSEAEVDAVIETKQESEDELEDSTDPPPMRNGAASRDESMHRATPAAQIAGSSRPSLRPIDDNAQVRDSAHVDEKPDVTMADDVASEDEADELRDEDDSDSSSVENDENTQIRATHGRLARRGVVARLSLINFMCHDKFEISFGPRLNFVVGHNGSGKSAILSAITLGLGAKASATSRGSNVKAFIKEGKDVAVIEVVLTNKGRDAYARDIYGDVIIVERIIRRKDNSSAWKIKSSNGKVVSNAKRELENITDHYNIQVDNPVNVLTQDQARTFLTSSNPSVMYEFFLKGSQLEHMRQDYGAFEQERLKTLGKVKRKRQGLANYEIKAREAQERFNIIKAAMSQQSRLEEAKNEAAWAFVQECEEDLEKATLASERLQIKQANLRKEIAKNVEVRADCERDIQALEAQAQAVVDRAMPMRDELGIVKELYKVGVAQKKEMINERTQLNQNFKACKTQITAIEKKMAEVLEEQRSGNRDHIRLTERYKQGEIEQRKFERNIDESKDRIAVLDSDLESIGRERDKLEQRRDVQRDRITGFESKIRQLKAAKADSLSVYGHNMPALVRKVAEVERARGWRGPVCGPIGSLIKIKDAKWAPVLESVLGNTLTAFCVTNHADRQLLQRLKREARCDDVSILTGPDEAFDYSAGEPDADMLTILRVLDIPNAFVRRQLINASSIERSVLVPRRDQGDQVFRNRRRNVKVCFTGDLFRVSGGEGGNSTQTLQPYKGPPRLSSDVDAQLADATQRLPEEEARLRETMAEHHEVMRQINAWNDERRELRKNIQTWIRELREVGIEQDRRAEELIEKKSDTITSLEAAKKDYIREREHFENAFRELQQKIEAEEERLEPIKAKRDRLGEQLTIMAEQGDFEDEIQAKAEARHMAIKTIAQIEQKEQHLQNKMNELEGRIGVLEARRIDDEARAQRFGERVAASKSSEELKKEIDAISAQIRLAQESHNVDFATIKREMDEHVQNYIRARDEINELEDVLRQLGQEVRKRWDKWQFFRRHISVKARNSFAYYMGTRGYEGRLKFKHNSERLLLYVKTEPGLVTSIRKDNRSLSGGEKSFSTICLLLSLWDTVGCPIRALDEFDVFMDAVNRRMSMSLIAKAAKMASNTQFILITPLDITNFKFETEVRINRLADPKR